MGAALTSARRYALFALVGSPARTIWTHRTRQSSHRLNRDPTTGPGANAIRAFCNGPSLPNEQSAELRDQMLVEIRSLDTDKDLLAWAGDGLARKNTLLEADARAIELAYQERLRETALPIGGITKDDSPTEAGISRDISGAPAVDLACPKEPARRRSKRIFLGVRRG
jgi:hypothetical protein